MILSSKAVSYTHLDVYKRQVVNTGLVMSLIYFLFKDAYATMKEVPVDAVAGVIMGVVLTNGVAEAIIAGVLVSVIGKVLLNLKRKQKA